LAWVSATGGQSQTIHALDTSDALQRIISVVKKNVAPSATVAVIQTCASSVPKAEII